MITVKDVVRAKRLYAKAREEHEVLKKEQERLDKLSKRLSSRLHKYAKIIFVHGFHGAANKFSFVEETDKSHILALVNSKLNEYLSCFGMRIYGFFEDGVYMPTFMVSSTATEKELRDKASNITGIVTELRDAFPDKEFVSFNVDTYKSSVTSCTLIVYKDKCSIQVVQCEGYCEYPAKDILSALKYLRKEYPTTTDIYVRVKS